MNPQDESDKLRAEAKAILREQFALMGQHFGSFAVDRVVDCIIGAAVLEIAACQAKAFRQEPQ